jgi:hypothetical protein
VSGTCRKGDALHGGGVSVFSGFNVEEVVTCCESMPDVARRFVPRSGFRLSGHFRLGCAETFLHGSGKVVFHDLAGYIFRLHTSIDVGVEGVGNDG